MVERIEERAFADCENLKSILLDEGVQAIESLAFSGRDLYEIVLPDSVRQVSRAAFNLCEGLTKPVYNRSGTVLYAYPRNAEEKVFTVPSRVKRINPGAFQGHPPSAGGDPAGGTGGAGALDLLRLWHSQAHDSQKCETGVLLCNLELPLP